MVVHYTNYYDLENYILSDVGRSFRNHGQLNAFDFFCIIIWKDNKIKTKVARQLLARNSDIEKSVNELTRKIYSADSDRQRLWILIHEYKFRLTMASAILALLYPDNFTMYDPRICNTLKKNNRLAAIENFDTLWRGYSEYIQCIRNYGPQHLSLRDKNRLIWGESFYNKLVGDLQGAFKRS